MKTKEKSKNRTQFQCYTKDYSIVLFFLFQILISILVVVYDAKNELISVVICSIHGFFALQQLILPKDKAIIYKQICMLLSKLASLILIVIVGSELAILIIALFERLDLISSKNNTFKQFDQILFRLITLIIMIFDFNLLLTITLAYTILIEINKLILERSIENKQIQYNITSSYHNTSRTTDQEWNYRLNQIPQCFIVINLPSLKVSYKNNYLQTYFKPCYENDEELDELILHKLQFSIVQDKIDTIQQLHAKPKVNLRQAKKQQMWNYKSDSISLQQSPQYRQEQSRYSLEFQTTSQLSIFEILTNRTSDEQSNDGHIEIFSDQSWQSIAINYNYSFSRQKLQLSGQIIFSEQEGEVLLTLIDVSKQNQLQELISNSEFKSKIIESFSHELRTPLNSALNFLVSCQYDKEVEEFIKEDYLQPAINSLKLQSYVISDIIDLSQISSNNFIVSAREFSISEILNEIIQLFKTQFEMKRVELKINLLDCTISKFTSDYVRLTQIIINLLCNSLKFSSDGIVTLQITSVQNQHLKISVSDQGMGIESDNLNELKSLLQNIEHYKDIQLNKTWQGFGLLISAILVNKLAPKENKYLQIDSSGSQQGTNVWFYVENQLSIEIPKQNTLRYSVPRFQSSHDEQLFNLDVNCAIFQATDFSNVAFSKQFNFNGKGRESQKNDFNYTDSQSFESLQFKYVQLSPLSPSLITDKLFMPQKNETDHKSNLQIVNLKMMIEARVKEDQEFLNTFQKKKKCTCQNLLSVDDEIFNQKSIQILLAKLGFDVILVQQYKISIKAFNGAEAIRVIEESVPCGPQCQLFTLILMDYQMPIMDGCTATIKLIEMMNQNIIPKIHIIGLTAFTNATDVSNCIRAGMSDVLQKPLNLKDLKEILILV
ncbi:unnamed protein product (macronuclear) [Paramecium tetraurelia]|uniref:Response regulatory domain-containing protein n=1 Tax=Paramecium tetraurelia TaxID=5888 RepID=A0DTK5_PARTE|nr:uncharacterized protein GSPATT00020053001 [Paramecium tetraurelia]CAK86372.1 unnamed protein product [Paramecium tetraurelia]|eukprot:XP_001453769.1 hypothetical protein (macronuclear) [Paramecium tetraurelia strain d4-2]